MKIFRKNSAARIRFPIPQKHSCRCKNGKMIHAKAYRKSKKFVIYDKFFIGTRFFALSLDKAFFLLTFQNVGRFRPANRGKFRKGKSYDWNGNTKRFESRGLR